MSGLVWELTVRAAIVLMTVGGVKEHRNSFICSSEAFEY